MGKSHLASKKISSALGPSEACAAGPKWAQFMAKQVKWFNDLKNQLQTSPRIVIVQTHHNSWVPLMYLRFWAIETTSGAVHPLPVITLGICPGVSQKVSDRDLPPPPLRAQVCLEHGWRIWGKEPPIILEVHGKKSKTSGSVKDLGVDGKFGSSQNLSMKTVQWTNSPNVTDKVLLFLESMRLHQTCSP